MEDDELLRLARGTRIEFRRDPSREWQEGEWDGEHEDGCYRVRDNATHFDSSEQFRLPVLTGRFPVGTRVRLVTMPDTAGRYDGYTARIVDRWDDVQYGGSYGIQLDGYRQDTWVLRATEVVQIPENAPAVPAAPAAPEATLRPLRPGRAAESETVAPVGARVRVLYAGNTEGRFDGLPGTILSNDAYGYERSGDRHRYTVRLDDGPVLFVRDVEVIGDASDVTSDASTDALAEYKEHVRKVAIDVWTQHNDDRSEWCEDGLNEVLRDLGVRGYSDSQAWTVSYTAERTTVIQGTTTITANSEDEARARFHRAVGRGDIDPEHDEDGSSVGRWDFEIDDIENS